MNRTIAPSPRSLDGFIFDMDGVLLDSEPFILLAAQRMFETRYNVIVPSSEFAPFVGAGEDRYLGGPAALHNINLTMPDDKLETYRIYLELIESGEGLKPLPGVGPLFKVLHEAGIKMAVASAADETKVRGNLRALARHGVDTSLLDAVVTGSEVSKKKPDPQCFLTAAAKIGVPPERCVVAEDAVNGVIAATAASSLALGITTTFPAEKLIQVGAVYTAPNLSQIPLQLLKKFGL